MVGMFDDSPRPASRRRRFYAVDGMDLGPELQLERGLNARPYLAEGDKIVLYKKRDEDVVFYATAIVDDLTEVPDSREPDYLIVSLSEPGELREQVALSVVAGSLRKTRNFLDPAREFDRRVVNLREDDYFTIVERRVDVSRTVFYYLYSSMPPILRLQFTDSYAKRHGYELPLRVRNYDAVARALVEFFQERVAQPLGVVERLVKVYGSLTETAPALPPIRDLRLVTSTGTPGGLRRADSVPFGRMALYAAQRIVSNPLLRGGLSLMPELLRECREQLERPESREGTRWWNETIS